MPRLLKQIIIAAVFFAAIGLILYFSLFRDVPEPSVAPAFSVQSPVVVSQKLLKVGELDYDFLAEIRNPNLNFGATDVDYELELYGQDNQLISVRRGSFYFLPGETKYEVVSPIRVEQGILRADFKIINADWQKLRDYVPRSLFSVKNQEFNPLSPDQSPFLRATLSNDSNFDFDLVDVYVILFDEDDDIFAVAITDIRTFLAKTDRFFEVKWAVPLDMSKYRNVGRIDINAYTDIFKNENFIKEHGTQEKFQRFY
ncbi:MAG: hypothetical protein HYT03_03655 [Candidatus Harrisonbacteria bacterium]|nr:hypothetical protein [Candidatus Harrisonbacteria bacterium]